ncbi:hypothetical protein [Kineosporia sp. R_H_3]|uniref:hypothetical protein n=1 Tax=Kineosporia sp. R_H_3 TaxID=1961848 RepID=UPI00117BAB57|nr:hypothetical protein [Kineosporia sp. R_H_3]
MSRGRADGEDTGAVAVLVAILMSAVLLTAGALTVDLGSAWAERVGLKGVAEAAALAGAALLPEDPTAGPQITSQLRDDVVKAAVAVLCEPGNRRPQWDTACATASSPAWAADLDPADGEVFIEVAEPNAYPDGEDARLPWVVRVVTPPVRVDFGLARISGTDHTDIQTSAGARRGLPWPAAEKPLPASPYYVTVDDLEHNDTGSVCLRTTPRPSASTFTEPAATSGFVFGDWERGSSGAVIGDGDGNGDPDMPDSNSRQFTIVGATFPDPPVTDPLAVTPAQVTVYVGVGDTSHAARTDSVEYDSATSTWRIRMTTPDLRTQPLYGKQVPVWWVYDDGSGTMAGRGTSDHRHLDFPPVPGVPPSDCDAAAPAGRGLVDSTSLAGQGVRASVRDGLATPLRAFGSWPYAQVGPDHDDDCYSVDTGDNIAPADPGDPATEANCVPLRSAGSISTQELTDAWLGTEIPDDPLGRLQSTCSTQVGSLSGRTGLFDQTSLFRRTNGLVTATVDTTSLRNRIVAGEAADATFRGQITRKIFECPRLLLVPVLDTSRPPSPSGHYAVAGMTYFWVSESFTFRPRPLRGLITDSAGQVVGIRGWVVDPAYVQGGDWVARTTDPDTALPMSVPKRAVLVRTLACNDHPDAPVCPP